MKYKIVSVLLIVFLLIGFLSPINKVSAQVQQSSLTQTKTKWISPDGQVFYIEPYTNIPVSNTRNLISILALGSRSITYGVNFYSGAGIMVWSYAWQINWTYNGTKVTALTPIRRVSIYVPGYAYKGDISSTVSGGVGQSHYYQYKTGDMCFIDLGTACIWHTYPHVEEDVNGTGGYYGAAGW